MNMILRLDKAITMLEVAEDAKSQNLTTSNEFAEVVLEVLANLHSIHNELIEIAEDLRLAQRKLEGKR